MSSKNSTVYFFYFLVLCEKNFLRDKIGSILSPEYFLTKKLKQNIKWFKLNYKKTKEQLAGVEWTRKDNEFKLI